MEQGGQRGEEGPRVGESEMRSRAAVAEHWAGFGMRSAFSHRQPHLWNPNFSTENGARLVLNEQAVGISVTVFEKQQPYSKSRNSTLLRLFPGTFLPSPPLSHLESCSVHWTLLHTQGMSGCDSNGVPIYKADFTVRPSCEPRFCLLQFLSGSLTHG